MVELANISTERVNVLPTDWIYGVNAAGVTDLKIKAGNLNSIPSNVVVTVNETYVPAEAVANHAALQARIDNGPMLVTPPGCIWISEDLEWDESSCPIITGSGREGSLYGGTTIKMAPLAHGDAVVKQRIWNANSAANSPAAHKGGLIENLAICGSWRKTNGSPTVGAADEQQTSGHGIAGAFYRATIRNVWIYDVAEYGIFIDTTAKDGTTALGTDPECLENKIENCIIEGTGLAAIRTKDSVASAGNVSDGFCVDNVIIRPNVKASKDDADGAGMGFHTLSGWKVDGNHIYASPNAVGGLLSYQPASRIGHGIYCQGGTGGARITNNKFADFGHLGEASGSHPYDTDDSVQRCGIHLLLNVSSSGAAVNVRPVIISGNEFNSREFNSTANHTCIRVTTSGDAGLRQVNIIGNSWGSENDAAQTLRGIEMLRTGSGQFTATIVGNSSNNGDADYPFICGVNPWGAGSSMTGNSWQSRTAKPSNNNHGTFNVGDTFWNESVASAGTPGWICTTGGAAGSAVFSDMAALAT
jgi:hypothetical protein